jgi:hypothetical protein
MFLNEQKHIDYINASFLTMKLKDVLKNIDLNEKSKYQIIIWISYSMIVISYKINITNVKLNISNFKFILVHFKELSYLDEMHADIKWLWLKSSMKRIKSCEFNMK